MPTIKREKVKGHYRTVTRADDGTIITSEKWSPKKKEHSTRGAPGRPDEPSGDDEPNSGGIVRQEAPGDIPVVPYDALVEQVTNNAAALGELIPAVNAILEKMGLASGAHTDNPGPENPGTEIQPAPAPAAGWSPKWEDIPEDWKKPLMNFMGDIGAGIRNAGIALAGGTPSTPETDADESLIRAVVAYRRAKIEDRLLAEAKTVVDAIDNEMALYTEVPEDK